MPDPRPVMIVGPVTWDVFPDGRRAAGGTVSFAARVAASMGVRAHVLTMASEDADLSALEGHEVHVLETADTLTFAHTFDNEVRSLRAICEPQRTLTPADAPASWPAPEVLLVAPLLASDIDAAAFAELPVAECGVTAQGFLRRRGAGGVIETTHGSTAPLRAAATARATIFASEEEIAHWPAGEVASLALRTRRLVITRGDRGAEIRDHAGTRFVPAVRADPVDTTGAGDVFAAAFILALGEGEATAARLAAAYAAANVEVVGPAPLPDRSIIERRLSDG
jgi:hypothetical protein